MRGATHRQRLLLILLAAAIPSFAQQQPNLEKGFHADKAYSSADLDHVNLFSGNLNVVIPLGQRYRVSSALDYGFTLVYSGNNWDTEFGETQVYEHIPGAGPDDYHWVTKQQNYSVPYRRSNAGLGWTFSLGRIINDTSPTKKCDCIVYQAPDGSEHSFMSTLHGAGANATTGYTNDNTYLRLRNGASWFVDFPDGNVHEFDKTSGDLKSITDPFGQTVSVSYSTVTSPDTEACGTSQVRRWDVTDSTGRHHYLDFRNDIQPYVSKGMVCRADLAAFGGQRSVYRMTYLVRTISRQAVYTETQNPAGVGEVTSVPLLASVELPGGAGSYAAIYDIGVKRNGSVLVGVTSDDTVNIPDATSDILAAQTPGSFTGHLISLQLPTRAKIAWTYAQYTLPPGPPPTPEPNGSGEFVQYTTRAAGVKTREITLNASTAPAVWTYDSAAENLYVSKTTVTEPATTTGPQTATTTYFSMCENCNVLPYKAVEYGLPVYRWEMPAQITSTIQNSYTIPSGATLSLVMNGSTSTVSLSSGVKTVNQLVTALNLSNSFNTRFYASASSDGRLVIRSGAVGSTVSFSIDGSSPSSAHGALGLDTATHEGSTDNVEDGHYLSSVVKDTSGNILKKTYVSYETDPNVPPLFGPFAYDYNRRLSGETVLTMKPGGSDRAFVNYSDFDGLGHYRTTVTGGNFGYGNVRTETVNYNKPDSDVDADAYESTPESGFQMPPNWILNRYSSRSSTENGGTAKTNYWFDADTGFLKRQRVLASGTSQAANDTIAEFTSTNGNVTREEYFGGDLTPANMLDFPSEDPGTGLVSDIRLSTISLSTAKYRLDHIYDKGSLKSSRYVNTATTQAMPFFIVDNDIDANTGLPSASRDAAGLATSFSYDLLGRLTTTTPPAGLTATTIAYHDATPTTKASVDVSTTPTASHVDYDELGRVRLEWSQFAANAWSVTESLYDAAGRKHKVSSPESASAVGTPPTFAHYTEYSYDALGRVTNVIAPDSKSVVTSYGGASSVSRTVSVAISASVEWPMPTIETYDRQGRLRSVSEHIGTLTTYDYDVGGRITGVTMQSPTASQTRSFTYDQRGFLTQENHPESGATVWTYDPRGHPLTKFVAAGSKYNARFTYDAAERLTLARTYGDWLTNPAHWFVPAKEFAFGTANAGTDRKLGKLESSIRHNYLSASRDVPTKETYAYLGLGGSLSGKTTEVTSLGSSGTILLQKFSQGYEYDALGLVNNITYPTCADPARPCGDSVWDSVAQSFTVGRLTAVTGKRATTTYPFVSGITYNANGLYSQITHGNGIIDTQVSTGGMSRPDSIQFGGYSSCTAPTIATPPANTTVQAPAQTALLSVSVYGTGPFTYQWFDTAAPGQAVFTTSATPWFTTPAFVSPPITQTRQYYVVVYNACGTITSTSATVNFCTPPTLSGAITFATPAYGAATTLSISASGSTPLHYDWYEGAAPNGVPAPNATDSSSYTTPALFATHQYWVRVRTDCDGSSVNSGTASVPVMVTAPSNLVASWSSTNGMAVQWTPSPASVHHYQIERQSASGVVTFSSPSTPFVDGTVGADTTYVYRVRAADQNDTNVSAFTNKDLATSTTMNTLTAINFIDIDQIRALVNRVRAATGLSALTWAQVMSESGYSGTPPPAAGAEVYGNHMIALRSRMDAALTAAGVAVPGYAVTVTGGAVITATAWTELRGRAQ